MRIQTITSLSLTDHWRGVKTHRVAKKQGSLDGACGPYALMNALMLSGVLSEAQVTRLWDGPSPPQSLLRKWSRKTDALVSQGTDIADLRELLQGIRHALPSLPALGLVPIDRLSAAGGKLLGGLAAVQGWIEHHDQPVIAHLRWDRDNAHWVVVVGSQFQQRGGEWVLANLLVLDSEENSHPAQAWNGVLGLGPLDAKRLRYTTASLEESIACDLVEAFGIQHEAVPGSARRVRNTP
jgi:hypothetical protein